MPRSRVGRPAGKHHCVVKRERRAALDVAFGAEARPTLHPEGCEYELLDRAAERHLLDQLILEDGCDVAVAHIAVRMAWHTGTDAQALWRRHRRDFADGSGTRPLLSDPRATVPLGEVWRSLQGDQIAVVLASD